MRRRSGSWRWVLAFAPISVAACSLVVDTSGLAGGTDAPDGSLDSVALEGATDGPSAPDADAAEPDGDAAVDAPPVSELYVAAVLADAPVLYLRLEDGATAMAAQDLIPTGPSGHYGTGITVRAAPGAFAGSAGVTSNGAVGGVVAIGKTLSFPGTSPFTLELWYSPTVLDTTYRFLVDGYEDVDGGRESFGIYAQKTYGLVFERYVKDAQLNAAAPFPSIGVYHHVVGTYDGTELVLYVDGAMASKHADTRSSLSTVPDVSFGAFLEGNVSVRGSIDELAVYDKALAAGRVAAHYKASGR